MKLSNYVHEKQVEPNIVGVYIPFEHVFRFFDARDWLAVKKGNLAGVSPEIISDLIRHFFLVRDGSENKIPSGYSPPPAKIREMWLVVSMVCNLRCRYCVVEGNRDDAKTCSKGESAPDKNDSANRSSNKSLLMTPEIAEIAIGKFQKYINMLPVEENARVTLYGGEPLLNPQLLHGAIPLIRKMDSKFKRVHNRTSIITISNGTIFREDLAELFQEFQVGLSISLDGMKRHHDQARIDRLQQGTYDVVIENIKKYRRYGLNMGICVTIGSHNIDDLPQIADYLSDQIGLPVELQLPFDFPKGAGNEYSVEMSSAGLKIMEAFERFRSKNILEGLTERRLRTVKNREFRYSDCGAIGGQLVVAPDGSVGPCHSLAGQTNYFDSTILGPHIDYENHPSFNEWQMRLPLNMGKCKGCSAISICGGGCPYNAMVKEGSIWSIDKEQCVYMKHFLDWLIKDKWRELACADSL